MRGLILALFMTLCLTSIAHAKCPATMTDCPSPTFNNLTIGGTLSGANVSGSSVTPTSANTSRSVADLTAQIQDVRNFFQGTTANCATDVSPAVTAAIAAGVKTIWLPKNCTYIPPSNTVPANLTIVGEDWQSSIIASDQPLVNNLFMGAHALIENVAVQGLFCYANANPTNVAKSCPTPLIKNVSDSTITLTNWAYETVYKLGPTSTAPGAASPSTDVPGIAVIQLSNGGDGIYVQTGDGVNPATTASGIRVVPDGSGDSGIYILPGLVGTTTNAHNGIFIKDLTNNTSGRSLYIDRAGNSTDVTPSLRIDDIDATGSSYTSSPIIVNLSHQTSGTFLSLLQSGQAFTGTFLDLQAQVGGTGSFNSGFFISAKINGSSFFSVGSNGQIVTNPGILIGGQNNGVPRIGSNFAIERLKFSSAGDTSVKAMFHATVTTSGSTAVTPTTDGTGTPSTSNCGNLIANNQKATVYNIILTATDVTTPANGYTYFMPIGHLARFTGVGTTTWQGGTPVEFDDGTTTGRSTSITADTTNSCPKISWTPPTGNTDTWHVAVSFEMDTIQ